LIEVVVLSVPGCPNVPLLEQRLAGRWRPGGGW
jgi:hypothetical protein